MPVFAAGQVVARLLTALRVALVGMAAMTMLAWVVNLFGWFGASWYHCDVANKVFMTTRIDVHRGCIALQRYGQRLFPGAHKFTNKLAWQWHPNNEYPSDDDSQQLLDFRIGIGPRGGKAGFEQRVFEVFAPCWAVALALAAYPVIHLILARRSVGARGFPLQVTAARDPETPTPGETR